MVYQSMKNILSTLSMKATLKNLLVMISMGCLIVVNSQVFAADVQIVGQSEQEIPAMQTDASTTGTKTITLDTYELSDKAQRALAQHMRRRLSAEQMPRQLASAPSRLLPRSVQLGMSNVPVLDQGRHGACVIFAATAAVDATLNRGSYTSQLCLLQLGRYFEKTNRQASGWDGLHSSKEAFDRINKYGVMSMESQQRYGCGGVYTYPYEEETPQSDMPLATYLQYREMLPKNDIAWSAVWSSFWFDFTSDTVMKTKTALSVGRRVVVASLLPRVYLGAAGAIGKHHILDDTWVLTPEIEQGTNWFKKIPGHEMIVTGYDDKASAVDRSGNLHRGLFTLRSSWGPTVGDAGNFYMSYDYFEMLVVEAIQIGPK